MNVDSQLIRLDFPLVAALPMTGGGWHMWAARLVRLALAILTTTLASVALARRFRI